MRTSRALFLLLVGALNAGCSLGGLAPGPTPVPAAGPAVNRAGVVISTWAQGARCPEESVLVMPFRTAGSGRFAANRLEADSPPPPAAPANPQPPTPPAARLPAGPKADGVRPVPGTPGRNDPPPPSFGL